jgi:molybdopterin/thiamine biosynthesis adenylyltransferase
VEPSADSWLSRERIAGYDPSVLSRGKGLLGGAGAGANNAALTLALSQLGELLIVDFDTYETHNATRSPFYPTAEEIARFGRAKARVVAEKVARLSTIVPGARGSRARFRVGYLQELPAAVFRYVDVVLNGADNQAARAFLAEQAFLAGRPFIDAGFRGTRLSVGVFVPQDPTLGACWRCRYPDAVVNDPRAYSCERFAKRVEEQGMVPAVQSTAQVAGALQAAQALQALHGTCRRANSVLSLDILAGDSSSFRTVRNPSCPSRWHEIAGLPRHPVLWSPELTWADVLDNAYGLLGTDAQLEPSAWLVETMQCVNCRRLMDVHASAWRYEAAPRCDTCDGPFARLPEDEARYRSETYYRFVDFTRTDLVDQPVSAFGQAAGDVFLVRPYGNPSAQPTVIELDGAVAALAETFFETVVLDSDVCAGAK